MPSFYEFFAGGGMARAGLGSGWTCLFANDIDVKKVSAYSDNWPDDPKVIVRRDVAELTVSELPGIADLVWASFPCQDLSLAGMGAGLRGSRSGTFWPFWKLMQELKHQDRHPRTVVLENVCGALSSHDGKDFKSLVAALRREGYRAGAVVIDAALFLPQSRPRLFIIGVRDDIGIDSALIAPAPEKPFHTSAVIKAHHALSAEDRENWVWWRLSVPHLPVKRFSEMILEDGIQWHSSAETEALLGLMSPLHIAKVTAAKRSGGFVVGTVYKRTRPDQEGIRRQRAEVRFDEIAGCLRTPGGGSSRQSILVVNRGKIRSRLLAAREAARLMGLSDEYRLPDKYNDAYHLMGDGVAIPVVKHIASNILEPLINECAASASTSRLDCSHLGVEQDWRQISNSERMRSRDSSTKSASMCFAT